MDYDYYENNDFYRNYVDGEHNFIFDMKIVPNYKLSYYFDPPGTNIVDHFKQLFYYTHFVLSIKRPDLISEMIE